MTAAEFAEPPVRTRVTARQVAALVRNPLRAIPPEVFTEPWHRFRAGGLTRMYVTDPELIHDAFVRHDGDLRKSQENIRVLGPALGEGLLTAHGAQWRAQRRAIAPVFQPVRLDPLTPAMLAAARDVRDRWLAAPAGEELGLGHEMMQVTFDIIVRTMLSGASGLDVAAVERAVTDYVAPTGWVLAFSLFQFPEWTPYPGRIRARRAAAFLREALKRRVAERRREGGGSGDLLDLLLGARDPEGGAGFSDEEVVDNLITFIAAGHETTALGLAWTLHLLDLHRDILERVQAEIDTVTGGEEVAPEHLERLTYTRQVFSEAMRLYPPAPLISRTALTSFDLGGRVLVEKGSALIIPIYAVHRHEALWPDPERFDPDRFTPKAVRARPRQAFMPFGAGPRVCIGSTFAMTEAVAVLAVLLQRLRLQGPVWSNDPEAVMRITLRPRPDLRMRVAPRVH